ncbi:Cullin-5 [Echinococcus granulosus]|uniref:Cullin-5 n=2 Tax=Echinococcus granulosus TaxID=6210 RepID=W6UPL2_ECHGR|nr:Cullin-5 [Echinococcus granulosus]EUB63203.1 Cullin-5 [Echinococcus granulosus]
MLLSSSQESVFQRRWPAVNDVVRRFLNMEPVPPAEWVKLFEDVYQIISWEESAHDEMFRSLTESIKAAIKRSQQRVMQSQDESSLLKAYIHEWVLFSEKSDNLPNPFAPLENCLGGKHNLSGPSKRKLKYSIVRKCMLDTWDVTIFEGIKQKLEDSAMKLVQDEREGAIINSALVIGVRESCVNLSATSTTKAWNYVDHFEAAYIKSMENFYRPRTSQFIAQNGIRAYLRYAQKKLAEEEARAKLYLDSGPNFKSIETLMQACVQVFVVNFKEEILAEFPKLLAEDEKDSLKVTYELIRCVKDASGEMNPLLPLLEDFIWRAGSCELRDNAEVIFKDADRYVNTLLDLFNRFSSVIEDCFHNDPSFLTIRDKAYQRLVNDTTIFSVKMPDSLRGTVKRPESRCPNLLAAFCDMLLRKSPTSRRLSSEEILTRLKRILLVLKYVNSKDLFMEAHKAHLMRRLILETSADNELEEFMVEKLREVGMPAELVNRLARMFQDIKVSHDLTREFQEKVANNNPSGGTETSAVLVSIKILSSGTWLPRSQPKFAVALPPELEDFIPQIEDFYKQKHQGRQLIWQYHLSHGLVAYYPPTATTTSVQSTTPMTDAAPTTSQVELEMTTLQIVVMFAWRHRDINQKLRLDGLLTATGLSDLELRRTLWSLSERPKMEQQIIIYSPEAASEKDFTNETEFWINPAFGVTRSGRLPNRRRVNMIGRLQLTQAGCEEESLAIVQLRQMRAQEAVVRVMKSRKRLTFSEVYQQVICLLKDQFIPSKRMLKEVIEWLIERRYIERDPREIDTFVYVS